MTYLVALDDGHGMKTPGKRTPKFPDGTFMHENEFNRAVVAKCKTYLECCGVNVLLTAPNDEDIPLTIRTDLANDKNATIFVSVHANALKDTWSNVKGIETFYYPGSMTGRKLAETLLKHLLKGTPLVTRGAKEGDYHVLRETRMPAAIVECGFMDNMHEAKLLMSDEYRTECAEELARGICEYLGVPVVDLKKETISLNSLSNECCIEVEGSALQLKGFIRDKRSLVPILSVCEITKNSINWDKQSGKMSINNHVLDTTIVIGTEHYSFSRDIAEAIGYQVEWIGNTRTVKFSKP